MKKDGVTITVADLERETTVSTNRIDSTISSKNENVVNQDIVVEHITTEGPVDEDKALIDTSNDKKGIRGLFSRIKEKFNEVFGKKYDNGSNNSTNNANNTSTSSSTSSSGTQVDKASQEFNDWVQVDTTKNTQQAQQEGVKKDSKGKEEVTKTQDIEDGLEH